MRERQIVLDTETTGIRVEEGHRIIEIGCVEVVDRKLTGRYLHHYVNPEREIEIGAQSVHGISNDFLRDKPPFASIANELIEFIQGAEIIIHNAPFDLAFLNNELALTASGYKSLNDYCTIICTLQMARKLHVGQRNTLDALCKRYLVDNSKRGFHGALLDAHLLAQVYLAMTGGQGSFFENVTDSESLHKTTDDAHPGNIHKCNLLVLKATASELEHHKAYLKKMQELGKCLWLEN